MGIGLESRYEHDKGGSDMEVTIERFKNIGSVELGIAGISLLVGGNNAGKSSVLQAIQFGASVAQTSAIQGGAWKGDRLSTSIGQGDLVYSPIKDVLSLAPNGRLRESRAESISITYRDSDQETRVAIRKGRNKNILLELTGRALGERLQSIQAPYCALVTGLAGIPSEEKFETNIAVRKAAARGDSNSVFRNILLQLMGNEEKWGRFQRQIGRIFDGYGVSAVFDPDKDETINCTVTKSGVVYPIDTCGTGVLQAIQIFSYINLFEPKILLLDEPDSHLHPNNQKLLARELIEASQGGLNIIISTHSKHLVEALIDNSNLVWLRNGTRQADVEDYELKALLEIGALNVGERIGNPTYIFLTEDKNSELFRRVLQSSGYHLEECEVVSYSGCTQIGTALALINHLRRSWPNAKYTIHRDRDFMDDNALRAYEHRFAQMNVKVFIPDGNDLESYFNKPAHIAYSCGITEQAASEIVLAAFNARKDDLTKKYVNTRIENAKRAGSQVNAGEISVECNNSMTGPESNAVHGKTLMKGVRDELRRRGIDDHLISNSAALRSDALHALWQEQQP